MTGKRYYLASFAAWQRHAHRCGESHFIVLAAQGCDRVGSPDLRAGDSGGRSANSTDGQTRLESACLVPALDEHSTPTSNATCVAHSAAQIFVLVSADEAAHIALETDAEFEALPHPLSRTPISEHVAAALAPFGVIPGDDTFTVAEKLACVNPLLRHRVF
jgi:hypothetical protein